MPVTDEDERDDLEGEIRAAMTADEPAKEPAQEAAPETEQAPEGPARDEAGRFAPKVEAAPEGEQPPAQPEPEAARPPASWSPEAKAQFNALPPVIQQEVLKRERDMDKGLQSRASELKRYEPLEGVIAPHRERWAAHGVTEDQAVGQLLAADAYLRQNPIAAISELAQIYGIDLRQFAQGAPQPTQLHPALQPILQEVTTLKQQLADQAQAQQQAQRAGVDKAIEAFRKDAIYFEDVEQDMAALISAGRVPGDSYEERIKNAYDMATHARPDIRKLILADQSKAKQELEAGRQAAAKAKNATGSITGASEGTPPPDLPDDIHAAVARAYESAGGRA